MRKALALSGVAAVITLIAGAGAASACGGGLDVCSGTTVVALTVLPDTGSLSIVPAPAAVGAASGMTTALSNTPVSTGNDNAKTATVVLGLTTVLDSRPSSPGWSMAASAPSAGFALVGGSATIAASKTRFYVPAAPVSATTAGVSGLSTLLSGAGTPDFGTSRTASAPASSNSGSPILVAQPGGINTASFTPYLQVDVTGAAAGLYTGSVTQSVS